MSDSTITYLVIGVCGLAALGVYGAWVLVPAWSSYRRTWERLAATVLSLYVLAALVGVGLIGGAAVVWFWDRIG
ncbi:MAG TPA: hypothetical protein VGN69_10830 [Solirubrobacteraceae bacterium]|nr:hypothetical protein [Solirubrobacteraceae bacterium]